MNSILLVGALALAANFPEDFSLDTVPPVVVKTVPEAGKGDIDPALNEIKVTFSKRMLNGSWSWSTLSKTSFPKTTAEPRYEKDGRTCVLPVKLERGKIYAIWINSEKFQNFQDVNELPAIPYLLVFQTKK